MNAAEKSRIIAWDTSSPTGVVCALEGEGQDYRVVAEWTLSFETSKHSERLLWAVDSVLEAAGWSVNELSAIGVGVGPGSFTGLRIGITTARILAAQKKIPVIAVSSLALLARGVAQALEFDKKLDKALIIAAQDAAKGEWFTLIGNAKSVRGCVVMAEGDLPGLWSRGAYERVFTPDETIEEAKKLLKKGGASQKWIAVGASTLRYPDFFKKLSQKSKIDLTMPQLQRVQAIVLAQMVWECLQRGTLRNSLQIKPRYLRDSDAEVKLKKGLLKPAPMIHRGGIA